MGAKQILRRDLSSVRWREKVCVCVKNVFVNVESRVKGTKPVKLLLSLAGFLPAPLLHSKSSVVQASLLALAVQCAFLLLTALSTSKCWNVFVEVKTNG
jgi:hypothetical protein